MQYMSGLKQSSRFYKNGFTLVELLIVVVVISILATVTMVSYAGVAKRAAAASLQSDLRQASTQLSVARVDSGSYPLTIDVSNGTFILRHSSDTTFEYDSDGTAYHLTASSARAQASFHIDTDGNTILSGADTAAGHHGYVAAVTIADGSLMQMITSANCPSTRTRAVDARDSHTYWVQKLADGNCWMLTNLGYAGGGTNTYSDIKSLSNGTGGSATYTVASYYVVPSTVNYTPEPTGPSTSTDGTGQYGYLYNWCAAMGRQLSTGACLNGTSPAPDASISICPAGWRLPTGNTGEFSALNTAINSGSTTSDSGLRTTWLSRYGGNWTSSGFMGTGGYGEYWSSTQYSATNAYRFDISASNVGPSSNNGKSLGFSVRCIAN